MSEQDSPSETLASAPVTPAHRLCRSPPDRRRAIGAAASALSGAPGQAEHVESLGHLADYVDELERVAWAGDRDTDPADFDDEPDREPESIGDIAGRQFAALLGVVRDLRPQVEEMRNL